MTNATPLAHKQCQQLERLSIVIPTRNRTNFIERQLDYWKRFPITLVIVEEDSHNSTTEFTSGLARVVHHKSPLSVTERLDLSCSLIDTEFVALSSDDDLYLPLGLLTSISQLDSMPLVVGSIGKSMRFRRRRKTIFGQLINEENQLVNLLSQDAMLRVLSNYSGSKISNPTFGVYRSQDWCEVTHLTYAPLYSSAYVYEFVWSTCMRYRGAIAVHDALSWMSSAENISTMDGYKFNRRIEISEWFGESRFETEVEAMKESVLGWMESKEVHSRKELKKMFDLHIEALLGRYRHKMSPEYQSSSRQVVLRLLPKMPRVFKAGLIWFLPGTFKQQFGLDIFRLDRNWKSLSRRKTRFSRAELEVFRDVVTQTKE